MHTITISSRLEAVAEFGATEITLFVWNSTKRRLEKEDIVFEDTGIKARKGEGYYRITWADAKVEGLPDDWNFDDVVKTHDLSQGQVLWLMAEDCNRNRRRAQANKA